MLSDPNPPPGDELQRAEHTACFAVAVAGLHTAEAEGLQVADGVGAALIFGDDVVHLQGPLVRDLLSNSRRRSTRSG